MNNQVLFILGLLFCPYFSYGSPSSCHEAVSSLRTKWPSYEEAQKIAQTANITTAIEYKQNYKELGGLPSKPNITYKEQWISWREFLGTSWPSYEEAQRIAQEANITTMREYKQNYKELGGLPSKPNITYKEQWISWREFLGTSWPSYEEAQRIAQEANITTMREYKQNYKELGGLPSKPHIIYKEQWISWREFLGTPWPSYEEAQRIAQEANITTLIEYKQKYKELGGLPSNPNITYKEQWISWREFLGTTWPSYEEAQRIAQAANITTAIEYLQKYKELGGLPSHPNTTYKEWISWREFLGTGRIYSKSWPSYEEAQKIAQEANITTQKEYHQKYKELGLPSNPHITYKEQWISWREFLAPLPQLTYKEHWMHFPRRN